MSCQWKLPCGSMPVCGSVVRRVKGLVSKFVLLGYPVVPSDPFARLGSPQEEGKKAR